MGNTGSKVKAKFSRQISLKPKLKCVRCGVVLDDKLKDSKLQRCFICSEISTVRRISNEEQST